MNKFRIGEWVTEKRRNYPMTIINIISYGGKKTKDKLGKVVYECKWRKEDKEESVTFPKRK